MAFNPFPQLTTDSSPLGSKENSPGPERLATLQHDSPKRGPSPCLPRKTIEELESEEFKRQGGTVDPDDPPLRTPWTFWFERAQAGGDDYSQALKNIYTVRTIKQFFSVYNNLRPPGSLKPKECYHLMRTYGGGEEPRKPLWEDPANLNGGIWVFKCKKNMTVNVWLELLLAAIGEQFTDSTAEEDDVFGISIKIREYETDTLQIWNENATLSSLAKVMDRVRSILPYMDIRDVFYSSIKEKLSGNRPYHTPSSSTAHYRESPPPQTHPRHSFNPSYRQQAPPRSGGFKRSPEGYYRYPSPRHPLQSGGRYPPHIGAPPTSTSPSQFS